MKTKLFAIALTVALLSVVGIAQTVTITSRKVTYKRPKPQMDFKKFFTITYPVVRASTPALSKKIEKAISPVTILDINLKEELGEYQWLETADFEAKYNDNGILCVEAFMEGSAAYPSSLLRATVVDARTGITAKAAAVFINIPALIALLKERQKADIAEAIVEIKKDPSNDVPDPGPLFEYADFRRENLEGFAINDKDVTFKYDYGFPNVLKALEPPGDLVLSWAEIKPFIKPGGLLSRITR